MFLCVCVCVMGAAIMRALDSLHITGAGKTSHLREIGKGKIPHSRISYVSPLLQNIAELPALQATCLLVPTCLSSVILNHTALQRTSVTQIFSLNAASKNVPPFGGRQVFMVLI